MRLRRDERGLDQVDERILELLQDDCKLALARIGELVGLSAPSVMERVRRLESEGFIEGYHARLDARRLGMDVAAFIGVAISHPAKVSGFEQRIAELDDVLECHHVTGSHTLLLKVKTPDTESLAGLISCLRSIEGVERTETNVVLSTLTERAQLAIQRSRASTTSPEPGAQSTPVHA